MQSDGTQVELVECGPCRGARAETTLQVVGDVDVGVAGPVGEERPLVGHLQDPLGQTITRDPFALDLHENPAVALDEVVGAGATQRGQQLDQRRTEPLIGPA